MAIAYSKMIKNINPFMQKKLQYVHYLSNKCAFDMEAQV